MHTNVRKDPSLLQEDWGLGISPGPQSGWATRAPLVLSIDCGSTNLKAALFDGDLRRLAEESIPVVYSVRDAEQVEFDAEDIWRAVRTLIRRLCATAGVGSASIHHIALTSQAQTFTILDRLDRPLMPFLSWMDRRATAESAQLVERFASTFYQHCSFPSPIPELLVSKVLWVQRHHPEWLAPGTQIVSLPGFLALRLAGVSAIDRNLAAMTGLYSLQTGDWWPNVVCFCRIRREQLPMLVDLGAPIRARKPSGEPALSPEVEVVFAGNDQTAGALGNAGPPGEVIVTLGTALVVYRRVGEKPGPYSPGGCWGPYPGEGFYELATRDEGCAALDWARTQLMPEKGIDAFMECAESISHGDKAIPFHSAPKGTAEEKVRGEPIFFYPEWMGTDGAWTGTGDKTARARAVLEGITFALRHLIVEELQIKGSLPSICVTGGGSRNRFWLQLLADVLNCPVRRGEGDALLGATIMALPRAIPPIHSVSEVWIPDPSRTALYEDLYRAWCANL